MCWGDMLDIFPLLIVVIQMYRDIQDYTWTILNAILQKHYEIWHIHTLHFLQSSDNSQKHDKT
jgi:hypothetical protein